MRRLLGVALILALGCGDDKNNPGTDGSSGGSSGGTSEGTTNPTTTNPTTTNSTTDNSGTMGESQTMGETTSSMTTEGMTTGTSEPQTSGPMTTEPMTSGPMTTGESTTGGNGSVEDDCMAACDTINGCMLGPDPEMCVPSCVDDLGGSEGACLAATEGYLQCISTMSCDELLAFFMNQDPGPCTDAVQAVSMACSQPGECVIGQDVNPQGTACSVTIECPEEPSLEMQCDKNECVCLIDGMQAGDPCPSEMICKTPDALLDKSGACCGF